MRLNIQDKCAVGVVNRTGLGDDGESYREL